jgi:hypothetical protein
VLTQTTPALRRSLQGAMSPQVIAALTQSLGNCNQPLTHRGAVNITSPAYNSRAGEYPVNFDLQGYSGFSGGRGVFGPGAGSPGGNVTNNSWNTNNYYNRSVTDNSSFTSFTDNSVTNNAGDLYDFSYIGDQNFVDFGDINNVFNRNNSTYNLFNTVNQGDSYVDIGGPNFFETNNNLYNSQFYFPTNQFFNQNIDSRVSNVFHGNTYMDNSITQNIDARSVRTTNVNVTNVNGQPVEGPAGPPGTPGRAGRDGLPGAPGAIIPIVLPPLQPPDQPPPPPPKSRSISYLFGIYPRVKVPKYKVNSTLDFDPSTCKLTGKIELVADGDEEFPVTGLSFRPAEFLVP